jgi:hypothetical protein
MAGLATDWRIDTKACFGCRQALLEAVIAEGGRFQVQQIKEKFGCLRFYWSSRGLSVGAGTRVKEAIDLAEARSACTCEICGEEGRLFRSGGWLITRCAAHAKGQLLDVKPCLENTYIMERCVRDGTRTVTFGRYDRATDSFIDVIPSSVDARRLAERCIIPWTTARRIRLLRSER